MKKIKVIYFVFALIVAAVSNSWAQIPIGEKLIGSIHNESCFAVIHTNDNGYAIVGGTTNSVSGDLDIYLTKLDSNENILWTKSYGGSGNETGICIKQTIDAGFIVCGDQNGFGAGGNDGYIIKTDSAGNMLWSKTYGLLQNDVLGKIELTSDGNYIAVGTTFSPGNNTGDIMVIKINDNGDTLWTKIIGGPVYDAGINLTPTPDGGCTICGRVYSYGAGLRDVMLSHIDGSGNVEWFKTYGGLYTEEGMAVTHTADNGYIITGATETFSNNGFYDVYIIKTDSAGTLVWSKTYGGDNIDATYTIIEAPDGGFVVAGFTDSWAYLNLQATGQMSPLGDDSSHVFLMKINAAGDTLWTRAIGGHLQDEAYGLINTSDGGFLVSAYSNSFSVTDSLDAYLIHVDSLGNGGCHNFAVSPHIGNPNTIENTYSPFTTSGLIVANAATIEDTISFQSNDPCAGVFVAEKKQDDFKITVFPNPFSDYAMLTFYGAIKKQITLLIFDVYGKQVSASYEYFSNRGEIKISRKNLADGIYFVELKSDAKISSRIKIVMTGKN